MTIAVNVGMKVKRTIMNNYLSMCKLQILECSIIDYLAKAVNLFIIRTFGRDIQLTECVIKRMRRFTRASRKKYFWSYII